MHRSCAVTGDRVHSHVDHFDAEHVVRALEAEGELASGLTGEAIQLCADRLRAAGVAAKRVLDLGCGPGVATAQLAQRFPDATIIAVDGSARMLAQVLTRAERHRLADRVETRQLDLDADLQTLGTCELAYAAMAIHHAGDEVATLASIRRLLAPEGLLCVLERAEPVEVRRPPSTLPGAMNAERYPEFLGAAGFEVVVSRTLGATVTMSRRLYIAHPSR